MGVSFRYLGIGACDTDDRNTCGAECIASCNRYSGAIGAECDTDSFVYEGRCSTCSPVVRAFIVCNDKLYGVFNSIKGEGRGEMVGILDAQRLLLSTRTVVPAPFLVLNNSSLGIQKSFPVKEFRT